MRRASLAAPLLLIGIGALFLARNVFPDLPLLDYLAKYWPLLLILWGTLRLAEILFWAATSRPLPHRGVSGGEWVLVVFLCMFGFSLTAARGFSNWLPRNRLELGGLDVFGDNFEYPVSSEKPCSMTPHVVIESFRGNARITGADVSSVKVMGRKTVRSMDQSGADAVDRETPFELAGDQNRVIVRTNQDRTNPGLGRPWRISDELEITVPKGALIEAHGRTGDFDISGINGPVDISSDNAGVRMENIGGQVRLDLRRSDIVRAVNLKSTFELKGNGNDLDLENIDGTVTINTVSGYRGMVRFRNITKPLHFTGTQTEFRAEKIPGEVRMPLGEFHAENVIGPIRVQAQARDVEMSDFTNSLELYVDRGDISLRPGMLPLAKMQVRTRIAGDIDLALPGAAKFDLNATSVHGEVSNDFGSPLREESSGKRGATMRGDNGGPTIDLETQRGRITVRKAGAEDVAPAAPKAVLPGVPVVPSPPAAPKPLEQ